MTEREEIERLTEQLREAVDRLAEIHHVSPLDDPEAMARATEALQVSADMPHDQRARYVVAAALGGQ